MAKLKVLLSHPLAMGTMIYGAASLLGKAIPFFLLPVMTKYLTPSEFGIVSTIMVFQAVIAIIMDFGMANRLGVNFFSKNNQQPDLIRDAVLVITAVTLIATPIFVAVWSLFRIDPSINIAWILLIVLIGGMRSVTTIQTNLWMMEQKALKYATLQLLLVFFETFMILLFVVEMKHGWAGRIGASLVVYAIGGIYSTIYLLKNYQLTISKEIIKSLIPIAIGASPMIIHSLGGWMITSMDRILISSIISTKSTGIYSLAVQLASIIGFATMAFNQAWSPFLFKTLSTNDSSSRIKIVRFIYLYVFTLFFSCILFNTIATWGIHHFINERYFDAINYLPWLLGQAFFWGVYYMATNFIFYAQQTKKLAILTIACGLFAFALNFLMIQHFGAIGAAISGCIVAGVYALAVCVLSVKVFPMPWLINRPKQIW